ncbi:MAG TPA: SET domain-containing protein [Jatrophihabitantaceae bacterium]|nr:SET domain-containing protein [Jatrophihabitantaceae bacterium]
MNPNERITVRRSAVHGRGVFAVEDLEAGERILAYTGELISWETAQARTSKSDAEASHTFFFDLGNGSVIDGGSGGNATGWINHGCEPNCEARLHDYQVVIFALRTIAAGDELLLEYQLQLDNGDEPPSAQDRQTYACLCGAATCRGTMLATA